MAHQDDGFYKSAELLSKHQNHEEDYTNFCGLLRKAELYILSILEA